MMAPAAAPAPAPIAAPLWVRVVLHPANTRVSDNKRINVCFMLTHFFVKLKECTIFVKGENPVCSNICAKL
jgi:hypothetical protein